MRPTRTSSDRTTSHARRLLLGAVVVATVALFVSCGGEGTSTITGPEPTGTTAPPTTGTTPPAGGATTPPVATTPPADTSATNPPATPPPATTPPPTGGTTPPDTTATPAPPTGGAAPSAVAGVTVAPAAPTLTVGDTLTLTATLQTTGTPPSGGWSVAWQSGDPSIVTVSASGALTARAPGTTSVTATAGGKSAASVVTVRALPWVSSVVISPSAGTLIVGDKLALTAAIGSVGPIPSGGWPVVWYSDNPAVVSVSATGVVTAVATGSTNVWAKVGNAAGYAGITVVAGPTVTAIALTPSTLYVALGGQGTFVPALTTVGAMPAGGWPITWVSASPAIATVDASGSVTGVAPGSTTVTATSYGRSSAATVAVSNASGGTATVVSAVTISPPLKVWLATGGKRTFGAAISANGPPPENGWAIAWTTSDAAVATVASNGVVTAIAPGSARITATVMGVSDTREVEVLPQPGLVDLRIDYQDPIQVTQGTTLEVPVTHYLVGSVPPGGLITTWTTGNPAIATVSAAGVLTGVALGNTTVTASSYGKTATVGVVVTAPVPPPSVTGVTGISVAPTIEVLPTGGRGWARATVTATTKPPGGLGGTDDWPVEWTSSAPGVLTVPAIRTTYMNFDAVAEGVTTLTAAVGGKSAALTVYVATPTALTVSPSAPSLNVGQQVTLVPTVSATGPLPPSGFPVGYQSSSPLVATVSPAGVVTAVGAGKTRIFVQAGPVQAIVIVTVSGPGLTLSLTGPTTAKGTIGQFDGTLYVLNCYFPMTMAATGSGTAIWGNEDWSIDGSAFKTFPGPGYQSLAAGGSIVWRVNTSGGGSTTAAQLKAYTTTIRTHYAVNADRIDYPGGIAQDYSITTTYTCQP